MYAIRSYYELAESCAMRHSTNRTPATPVLRHGSLPKLIKAKSISEQIAEEIKNNINLGMKTIAVIDKMPADCITLYKELKKTIPEIAYLDDKDTVYQGGIMVMPAYLCKGLEFDCVIIANCESDNVITSYSIHYTKLYETSLQLFSRNIKYAMLISQCARYTSPKA